MRTRKIRLLRRIVYRLNVVAFFVAFLAGPFLYFFAELRGRVRVTELDRHRVINHTELGSFSPDLAEHPRNQLADWIQTEALSVIAFLGCCLFALAVLNLVSQDRCRRPKRFGP